MSVTAKEIQEIIKKNLPQEVGDILKQRLEQANIDEVKTIRLNSELIDAEKRIKELVSEIVTYKVFDERNTGLEAREKYLDEKERNVELENLKIQLAAETSKTNFAKDVAMGLVRNTEYRKNIFDSESQPGYPTSTGWVQPSPINKNLTETQTTT